LHTCSRLGCGLKVADQETVFCKRHDWQFNVATSTQWYARQGGGYGQAPFGILDSLMRRG
jgi:nitrite reductase/ring-hydroxylating ferredoxin subunit